MSITDITNKIITDAEKRALALINDARVKATEIENKTKKLKESLEDTYAKRLKRALDENEKKVILAANQEVKLKTDVVKREAVNNVFTAALKELGDMGDDAYEHTLKVLVQKLPKDAPGKIVAPRARKKVTEKILKNEKIPYTEIEATDDIVGGFIFLGDTFEYNLSFEELLKNKKSEMEVAVANILFNQ